MPNFQIKFLQPQIRLTRVHVPMGVGKNFNLERRKTVKKKAISWELASIMWKAIEQIWQTCRYCFPSSREALFSGLLNLSFLLCFFHFHMHLLSSTGRVRSGITLCVRKSWPFSSNSISPLLLLKKCRRYLFQPCPGWCLFPCFFLCMGSYVYVEYRHDSVIVSWTLWCWFICSMHAHACMSACWFNPNQVRSCLGMVGSSSSSKLSRWHLLLKIAIRDIACYLKLKRKFTDIENFATLFLHCI